MEGKEGLLGILKGYLYTCSLKKVLNWDHGVAKSLFKGWGSIMVSIAALGAADGSSNAFPEKVFLCLGTRDEAHISRQCLKTPAKLKISLVPLNNKVIKWLMKISACFAK